MNLENLDKSQEYQKRIPKVALLIETSRGYGRGIVSGIARYVQQYGPWEFYLTPGDFQQAVPKMKEWNGTGIIARIQTEEMALAIHKTGLPTVALDAPFLLRERLRNEYGFSEMISDSEGAAKMAAEYLIGKNFKQFAFVGYYNQIWSDIRKTAFQKEIAANNFDVYLYEPPIRKNRQLNWEQEQPVLMQWLQALPKPIGLMVCNDLRGREVLDACNAAGISVPEHLAVIGVDNDECLCQLSNPPLTSVSLNTSQGGYLAASHLDDRMKNPATPLRRIIVPVLRIEERHSTDTVAIDDPDVAMALRFIHQFSTTPINVQEVVEHVAISRRSLEQRFKRTLGSTILREIHKVRLERVKRFLQETDLPIPAVARATGFRTDSYLIQVFRNEVGMTPTRYRSQIHNGLPSSLSENDSKID